MTRIPRRHEMGATNLAGDSPWRCGTDGREWGGYEHLILAQLGWEANPERKLRTARTSHGGTESGRSDQRHRMARVRRRWTFAIAWSAIGSPRIRPASWILRSGLSINQSSVGRVRTGAGAWRWLDHLRGGTRWPRAELALADRSGIELLVIPLRRVVTLQLLERLGAFRDILCELSG